MSYRDAQKRGELIPLFAAWAQKFYLARLNGVGRAPLVSAHAIGLRIVEESFRHGIKGDFATQLPTDGGREAGHPIQLHTRSGSFHRHPLPTDRGQWYAIPTRAVAMPTEATAAVFKKVRRVDFAFIRLI